MTNELDRLIEDMEYVCRQFGYATKVTPEAGFLLLLAKEIKALRLDIGRTGRGPNDD